MDEARSELNAAVLALALLEAALTTTPSDETETITLRNVRPGTRQTFTGLQLSTGERVMVIVEPVGDATPSDTVLVERARLREIERKGGKVLANGTWQWVCPKCRRGTGHAPDCWFAAAIGDTV